MSYCQCQVLEFFTLPNDLLAIFI